MAFVPGGGGFLVPPIHQIDRSYGLLTSVDAVQLDDPHWQSGFEWESDCSVITDSTLPPCPEPVASKSEDGGLVFCSAEPFTVYGSYKCSTGGRPVSEAMDIAGSRLRRNKESGVEKIFWTGITPAGTISPSLQGGNSFCDLIPIDLTPPSGAVPPVLALATLESNMVECIPGGVGVFHMNVGLLPFLARDLLYTERDGKLYSPSGQLIIAGAGYPGTGPGNVPVVAGETWIFATGLVAVFKSDIFFTPSDVSQAINRRINDITFYAEQTFSVIWECCVFAIRVSLC